jgi:hypothetical protein
VILGELTISGYNGGEAAMKFIKLFLMTILSTTLLSCGGGSPYTSASGGAVPVGTTSFLVTPDSGATYYTINGGANPSLTLQRGVTYRFTINSAGHPFYIMSTQGTDTANAWISGVSGNGTTNGTLTFAVPSGAPDTLYYDCSVHPAMTGVITITN